MKKKGFTLIELLAVIVILAVIALIATPMIMDVIEKSKRGAAVDSAYGYLETLNQYMVLHKIEDSGIKMESNGIYRVEEETFYSDVDSIDGVYLNQFLTVKGSYPSDGYIELKDQKFEYGEFDIDGYHIECTVSNCAIKEISHEKIDQISIVESDHYIGLDETMQLHVSIQPEEAANQRIKWSSSNESVATVDNKGLVKTISYGQTIITASANKDVKVDFELNVSPFYEGKKIYLYKNGLDNTELTGGYVERNQSSEIQQGAKFTDEYVQLGYGFKYGYIGTRLFTRKKIDITNYKQLRILYNATEQLDTVYNTIGLGIASANTSYTTPMTKSNSDRGLKTENTILTLDISDIKGEYYIYTSAGSLKPYIYEIWLER